MLFDIDKQTERDLNLFQDRSSDKPIFSIYSHTATKGGQEMMNKLFRTPVSDIELLQGRKDEINFFFAHDCVLKLKSRHLDFIEHYLNIDRIPLRNNIIDATFNGIINKLSENGNYWIISNGILHTVWLLNDLKIFINDTISFSLPETLKEDFDRIENFVELNILTKILIDRPENIKDLTFSQINNLDNLLRASKKNLFRELLSIVYKIDVLQTLSRMMKNDGFTLPEYSSESQPVFEVCDAFYPLLASPVPNSFTFNYDTNLCFITGPNMAGKSTFLKTMGLMIYLSHLGFPVPAKHMKTTVFDGLFTTINLADNLNLGYSHFYSEVQRVKEIVLKINSERKLFVIFDELFRGTNVKDAYDGSLMIISALAKIKGNLFFISSHILEVAENLENKDSILFNCFESELIDQTPIYDFKLKDGVSKERIGMIIIKHENIMEILDTVIEKQNTVSSSTGINNYHGDHNQKVSHK
jgi:DNA mismatch repair protein MutS